MDLHESRGRRTRRWPWLVFWGAVGTACLGLLVVQFHYDALTPSPYDLTVLGQADWIADSGTSLHVRLVSRDGGRPVPDRPVELVLSGPGPDHNRRVALARTGADGSAGPRFRIPDWPDGAYELRVSAATDRGVETVTKGVNLRRAWRVMLSTDKPVYQPGHVIRLRGLALRRPDLRPRAGQEMSFAVIDPKGNVIFRERVPTSAYGIASADCPLASELIEGTYQFECKVGETTRRGTVEVNTYVLPRFKVALDFDRPYYSPGQVLRGTVRADYVFGKPVGDATVALAVETTEVPATTIQKLALKTDATGRAGFEVRLPERLTGRPQDNGDARLAITAAVRDAAGQSDARTDSRMVTDRPVRIEVVPEQGTLVRNVENTVYILTTTPDGQAVRTRLSVEGIEQELRTDDLGLASVSVTPKDDQVTWMLRAIDEQGREGRRKVMLRIGEPSEDFLVRTDKAVVRGGEPLRVHVFGGGVEPVFLDLIKDGQTVLSASLPVTKGQGALDIDLPAELAGTVVLCAYRYGGEGLPVRKTRVIQVEPANALTLRTAFDRDGYRPGERARLTIDVADGQGRPAPGAVSLAAVDEAVFGVLDRRPGLERTFFTLEQELLEPLYEIHEWSPHELDARPPAERDRFEQALFARTAAPPSVIADFERGTGPHTLSARTYPEKARKLELVRNDAQMWLKRSWARVAAVAFFGALVWLFLRAWRVAVVILACVFLLACLTTLLWVAVQPLSERELPGSVPPPNVTAPESAPVGAAPGGDAEPVRVRRWFPETLLWRPELITDDQGHAQLEIDLADSITTWRLSAGAVTADGRLGGTQAAIRVFQPFFVDLDLPVALTRGDEVGVPVVVSNYLDRAQSVTLRLEDAAWFDRLDDAGKTLELPPNAVRLTHYRIRVKTVGNHELQVTARGEGVADAVKRPIEVVSDGQRVEQVSSGTLPQPAEVMLEVPEDVIEGSVQAFVKLYPSSFSQLVEGLDAIFQMPYGCFEQTSLTTYPNVLALDYLRRTKKSVPEVEAKARQYIHLGYQRLLSFEVQGGGFEWFGRSPANRTLTAYGLMEFQDMARVHDIDPSLVERTRRWLLDQQRPDGSWDPDGKSLHEDPAGGRPEADRARQSTTAFIAWAVFAGREHDSRSQATLAYLRSQKPESIDDPYGLALVASAILALSPGGDTARPYLERLESLRSTSQDGKLVWWDSPLDQRTLFHGGGRSRSVETTALATLALLNANPHPEMIRGALSWLISRKDGRGLWYSTHATVLALKALLAGTGRPLGGDQPRRLLLSLDGQPLDEIAIAADQADVVRQIDLSSRVVPGTHRLTLQDRGDAASGYQVVVRYHVPQEIAAPERGPLAIQLDYDRSTVAVDDVVSASVSVTNKGSSPAAMIVLDLPIPAGFAPEAEDLEALVASGVAAKWQRTPRQIVVYLRDLEPEKPLRMRYRLRATMPVRVTVPAARAYSYYEPERGGMSRSSHLSVEAR